MNSNYLLILLLLLLPSCGRFEPIASDEDSKNCSNCGQKLDESLFHADESIFKRRWQTPRPESQHYQDSYQSFYSLVGYADIRYTDTSQQEADVCIVCQHRSPSSIQFVYFFDDQAQLDNCRRFTQRLQKTSIRLRAEASDGAQLRLAPVSFIWNIQPVRERPGDYRNGQKGAIAELFGWPFDEIRQECPLLGLAGYLGVKLSPVAEHIMSSEPENEAFNPWYYVYQPISYEIGSRYGSREDLENLVQTCRSHGVRVYVDIVLNHMTGPVSGSCDHSSKKSSASIDRQSPFFTHRQTANELCEYEYPGAGFGPEDFHCERPIDNWDDLDQLNNGWLAGLADLNTTRPNVLARQSAHLADLLSSGVSGFRIDAAKHMSPEDLAAIFQLLQTKMGGQLPTDFVAWLEVLSGSQAYVLWQGPSWYGHRLTNSLINSIGSSELHKIKLFDSGYPVRPWENEAVESERIVIQNDDHDSQSPVFYRDFGDRGCILVKGCGAEEHRYHEMRLFADPYEVRNRTHDWPIRVLLSSFYHTKGILGVPDGLSDCSQCVVNCGECGESVPYSKAHEALKCGYEGDSYTRVHRDVGIINAMRSWMGLGAIDGIDIGLPDCH